MVFGIISLIVFLLFFSLCICPPYVPYDETVDYGYDEENVKERAGKIRRRHISLYWSGMCALIIGPLSIAMCDQQIHEGKSIIIDELNTFNNMTMRMHSQSSDVVHAYSSLQTTFNAMMADNRSCVGAIQATPEYTWPLDYITWPPINTSFAETYTRITGLRNLTMYAANTLVPRAKEMSRTYVVEKKAVAFNSLYAAYTCIIVMHFFAFANQSKPWASCNSCLSILFLLGGVIICPLFMSGLVRTLMTILCDDDLFMSMMTMIERS